MLRNVHQTVNLLSHHLLEKDAGSKDIIAVVPRNLLSFLCLDSHSGPVSPGLLPKQQSLFPLAVISPKPEYSCHWLLF